MEANSRIVVVGASDTGLTFIETLLQLPHIRFTSLTLISPEGLQTTNNCRFSYIPSTLSYADNELELMVPLPPSPAVGLRSECNGMA